MTGGPAGSAREIGCVAMRKLLQRTGIMEEAT